MSVPPTLTPITTQQSPCDSSLVAILRRTTVHHSLHFRVNYTLIVLLVVFLNQLYHPISMIVFLVIFILWFFLYFFRDDPVMALGHPIDDRAVMIVLWIATVVALVLMNVRLNVLVSLAIGLVLVAVHVMFRITEDLFLDENEAVNEGFQASIVKSPMRQPYVRLV